MKLEYITNNEKIKGQVAYFLEKLEDNSDFFFTTTSGSTGKPKTIKIDKGFAKNSAFATINFLKLKSSDSALLCLNIDTIGGKMMLVRSLVNNMTLYVEEPSSNPLRNCTQKIDFIALAPIQLNTILVESVEKLKSIQHIIIGGGIISNATINRLKDEKLTVYQTFGMTETISHIALRKVGYETDEYYTALDNIHISSVNNQLCIHAPGLGIQELVTNDLIELKNNKQFNWVGRADFVINSGGVKIQIEELEKELQEKISDRLFIFPRASEKFGQKVTLIIEGKEKSDYLSKKFYSFLKNSYHIPKEIVFAERFLLTPSDKIDRLATIETIKSGDFRQVL